MTTPYTDALERALGRVIKDMKAQAELHVARMDAVIAGYQAKIGELEARSAAAEAMVHRRADEVLTGIEAKAAGILGAIRAPDPDEVSSLVGQAVSAAMQSLPQPDLTPIVERLAAVEAREMPEVIHGKDAVLPDIPAMVREAVSAIELPAVPDVVPIVREAVAEAVAAIPAPKDGADGKDADPEVIKRMIAEALPPVESLRGPPGRIAAVKSWSDTVHYDGDIVTHRGSTYQALRDTGREPPHSDWVCLAARGDDGRSVDVRGTYDEAEVYRHLDIVALNGGSFIALKDDPGPCPGEGWQLLASRGKPGQAIKGDPGERGEPGPAGKPGLPLVAADVDSNGVVVLTNGDGSTVTLDLYPVLAQL